MSEDFCPECGHLLSKKQRSCPFCGGSHGYEQLNHKMMHYSGTKHWISDSQDDIPLDHLVDLLEMQKFHETL